MAIDHKQYAALKEANPQTRLVNIGAGTIALAVPTFDSLTGQPIAPVVQKTNLKEINDALAAAQLTVSQIEAVLDDATAALA